MKTIDIDTFLFGAYVTIIAFEEGCSETGATDLDLGEIRVQSVEDADKALRSFPTSTPASRCTPRTGPS